MKKKVTKKLVLKKETLRSLESRELGQAAGGASQAETFCCSGYNTCGGTGGCGTVQTGGSRYC